MRISELYEAVEKVTSLVKLHDLDAKVNHAKVVALVYKLALASFDAPKNILADAKFNIQHTDQFWVEGISDLTHEISRFIGDPEAHESEVYDSAHQIIGDVRYAMYDYYSTAMNHPPGYEIPKLKTPNDKSIKDAAITAEFSAAFPGFVEAVKIRNDYAKHSKAVDKKESNNAASAISDTDIEAVANAVDAAWATNFSEKVRSNITKWYVQHKAHNESNKNVSAQRHFSDYPFPIDFAPKSDSELALAVSKTSYKGQTPVGAVIRWVGDDFNKKLRGLVDYIEDDKVLSAKVASKSKNLSRVFPK